IRDFHVTGVQSCALPILEAYLGKHVHFEFHGGGTDLLIHLSPIVIDNKVKEVVGTAIDISERLKAEEKIKYMAYRDLLTDLPNRSEERRVGKARKIY